MATRTLQQMIATVQRRTGGQVSPGSIFEALNDANKRVHRLEKWPWLFTTANIPVQGSYTTGTISVNDQSTAVTGNGTTWTSLLPGYYSLYFGTNSYYPIQTIGSDTSLTLKQAINTGSNWTNVAYTIYQDTYALPADCEPGAQMMVVNPRIRYRLLHIPRWNRETRQTSIGVYFSNFQDCWSEAGYDDTTTSHLIVFSPPPSATTEYLLIYRRQAPDLVQLTDIPIIPESFNEALCFIAEYLVKRHDQMPGWQEAKQEGYQIVTNLRRQISTQPQDIFSMYRSWPMQQTPSMYGAGLIISQPSGSL